MEKNFDPQEHKKIDDGFVDKTALSKDMAENEAKKIQQLVGDTGSSTEYSAAERAVEEEQPDRTKSNAANNVERSQARENKEKIPQVISSNIVPIINEHWGGKHIPESGLGKVHEKDDSYGDMPDGWVTYSRMTLRLDSPIVRVADNKKWASLDLPLTGFYGEFMTQQDLARIFRESLPGLLRSLPIQLLKDKNATESDTLPLWFDKEVANSLINQLPQSKMSGDLVTIKLVFDDNAPKETSSLKPIINEYYLDQIKRTVPWGCVVRRGKDEEIKDGHHVELSHTLYVFKRSDAEKYSIQYFVEPLEGNISVWWDSEVAKGEPEELPKTIAESIKAELDLLHRAPYFETYPREIKDKFDFNKNPDSFLAKVHWSDLFQERAEFKVSPDEQSLFELEEWSSRADTFLELLLSLKPEAKSLYERQKKGEILVDFEWPVQERTSINRSNAWVIGPDGKFFPPEKVLERKKDRRGNWDVLSEDYAGQIEGVYRWPHILTDEYLVIAFSGPSLGGKTDDPQRLEQTKLKILKQPISGCTAEQIAYVKNIEKDVAESANLPLSLLYNSWSKKLKTEP